VQQVKKIEGTGSVWNTGSYHWEEKSVNKWAEEKLRNVLSGFKYKWQDAEMIITEIKEFKGESSVSIRKGKKIVAYDYQIILVWQIDMRDKDAVIATAKGQYEFPEMSNEEDEWEVRITMGEDKQSIQKMLEQLIRTLAVKELKETIKRDFVEELMKK
jgi:activator of HSP90 ATPase